MSSNDVNIRFTAQDAASETVQRITRSFGTLSDAVRPATAALASLGVVFSAGAVLSAIRSTADALDRLNDAAEETGVAVDALAGLRYAAIFAGQSGEVLDKALIKLNTRITDAAAGGKESAAIFRALGVSVADLAGNALPADEVLAKLADKFSSFRDGAEKSALASQIFGEKVGPKLLPLLNQGSEGLSRLREEAERLGIALSPEKVKQAAAFNDAVDRLAQQFVGLRNSVLVDVLPAITRLLDDMERGTRIFGSFSSALVNVGLGTNPFVNLQANIEATQQKIAALREEQNRFRNEYGEDTDAGQTRRRLEGEIAQQEKLLSYLKETQRVRALEGSGGLLDARDALAARSRGGGRPPRIGGDAQATQLTDAQRALAQYVEGLQRAIEATEDLSLSEKTAAAIRQGAFGEVSAQERQLLMQLAERADAAKAFRAIEAQAAQDRKREDEERAKQAQRIAEWETRLTDQTRQRYSQQTELFLEDVDRNNRWRTQQLQIAIDARTADLISEEEYQIRRAQIQEQYAQVAGDIEARRWGAAKAFRKLDLEAAKDGFSAMAGLMNSNSRKLFEVGKAASIANAIVSTYEGVNAVWAKWAAYPPVAAALSAVTIATGFANVQRIKNTQFGGGASGGGGSVSAGNVAVPGQGPFATGAPQVAGGTPERAPTTINITLNGSGRYTAEDVRELMERMNEQAGLGIRLVTTTV